MKLAWLCYNDDEDYPKVTIKFEEPEDWRYDRVVLIAYTEIIE